MSLKRFNADLQSARRRLEDTGIPGIVALEHGEEVGEIVVTFVHEELTVPVLIRLVSAKPYSYPDGNNFLLTADAQDVHPAVIRTLEDLQNFTFGQTVFESLRDVSSGLLRALSQSKVDADGDTVMHDAADDDSASVQESDEEDFDGDDYDDNEDEDLIFGLGSQQDQKFKAPRLGVKMTPGVLNKIRRDLRKAREAGAKIGIMSGLYDDARTHMFSLSIRARKLGISDEALEAWDIDPAQYIVLLCRIDEPYPSAEELLEQAASSIYTDFRFGKCTRSKPSPDSARREFNIQPHTTTVEQNAGVRTTATSADSHPFTKLFISDSMEQFMNEHFFALMKLRLTGCQSWDDANSRVLDFSSRYPTMDSTAEASEVFDAKGKGKAKAQGSEGKAGVVSTPAQSASTDALGQQTLPTILTWNSFVEPDKDISMPLVAMQFALHYFVRCTEYCLRCHRKVKKEFEALKPYVCENPLCLFQYITMGLGPSIEHEIMSQPYVVDLLVTLCYSSIQSRVMDAHAMVTGPRMTSGNRQSTYPIRDFPTGLRLKVASLPPAPTPSPSLQPLGPLPQATAEAQDEDKTASNGIPIKVLLNFDTHTLCVQDQADIQHLAGKSWVVLRHHPIGSDGRTLSSQVLIHQAYLKYVDGLTNMIEFEMKQQDPSLASYVQPGAGPQAVDLYKYDIEFDDLGNSGKARAMTAILSTIPPISHLREYLINHPHSRLRSYDGISSSAATLLEWIVASNRSFILQVNHVNDIRAQDLYSLRTIKTRDQEVIPSMSQDYAQFRFAMGNPDKELRFQRALKESKSQAEHLYPTLFAWHGSAVQNWHSILRQGLDFRKIANGRAFGDGVYFSPHYTTSQVCTVHVQIDAHQTVNH